MSAEPKARDADRSRAAILDAAEALFAERGYRAVTMQEVGAAAGLSRGTPGYFFGSKSQLYQAVTARAADQMRSLGTRAGKRSGDATAREVLNDALAAFGDLLADRPALVRLVDHEAAGADGNVAPHVDALRAALAPLGEGEEADRLRLSALALLWFPVSHPAAARALGYDTASRTDTDEWRGHVVSLLTGADEAADEPDPAKARKKRRKKSK